MYDPLLHICTHADARQTIEIDVGQTGIGRVSVAYATCLEECQGHRPTHFHIVILRF
jgi:hypothetical protein